MTRVRSADHVDRLSRWDQVDRLLARRLEEEALSIGLKATELAEKLGISEQRWRKLEAGTYRHPGLLKNLRTTADLKSRHKEWAEAVQRVVGYEKDELCQYHAKWFLNLYAYLEDRFGDAKRLAEDRVRLARELGEQGLLVEALSDLGHAETRLAASGRSGLAPLSKHFLEAQRLIGSLTEQARYRCHLSFRLGWGHMYAGHYEKAATHFERALKWACETGDVFVKGRTLINISRNLRRQGRLREGLQAAKKSLEYAIAKGSNVLEALNQRNLALVYQAQGDQQLAREHWDLWQKWKQKSTGCTDTAPAESGSRHLGQASPRETERKRAP